MGKSKLMLIVCNLTCIAFFLSLKPHGTQDFTLAGSKTVIGIQLVGLHEQGHHSNLENQDY